MRENRIPKGVIDTLRDGTAPEAIRRMGAQGDLPVPLAERLEILLFLSNDSSPEVSQQALHTLRRLTTEELEQVLSDPASSSAVIDFVFDRMLEKQKRVPDGRDLAVSSEIPGNPANNKSAGVETGTNSPLPGWPEPPAIPDPEVEQASAPALETDVKRQTLLQRISAMTVAQKVRLALMGNQGERLILIRDPNRVVVRAVVHSPKLSDAEIESFAAMRNVQEEVLRIIANNRAFVRNPAVIRALVFNPRSPVDVTLPLIKHLKNRDLKLLTVDKNVPETVRTTAVRLYVTRAQSQRH